MEDKIIEILKENIGLYSEGCTDNIADGLLFEPMCEDSAKEIEALFGSEMKEQSQVIEILKGHVDSLQEQLAQRDEIIKVSFDRIEELRKQINKLKAEL